MKIIFDQFITKTNNLDKILISLIFLFPFLLTISIFLADLFASIAALIVIGLYFISENKKIFSEIKRLTFYFFIFYFFILLSLIFSISFKDSFLPSFFYFRYFLFSIGIYYLFKKYSFFKEIIFYSLILTFALVSIDALFQYIFGYNTLGSTRANLDQTPYITGFFGDEKKLGSYFVRLLPLFLSLFYFLNLKKFNIYIILIIGFFIFLSSERIAFFLYIIISSFYFIIIKDKLKYLIVTGIFFLVIFSFNEKLRYKQITYTLKQLGFIETYWNKNYMGKKRYYSKEHEDLALTAFVIAKDNFLNGSGIKTFYKICNQYKLKEKESKISYLDFLKRNNNLQCSTHPHNIYLQILSEVGVFGFLIIFFIFLKILYQNIKIIFKKNLENIEISYYFLNIGIIINLFPMIPSGNFFNNWLSLILFYPLGFWLYLFCKIKKKNKS